MLKTPQYCSICVNPTNSKIINPETGNKLVFHNEKTGVVCDICKRTFGNGFLPSRKEFDEQLELFFDLNKRILFAYSGGLDSTVTLSLLSQVCKTRNIELVTFTVNTYVKGKVTKSNINNILTFLGLSGTHFYRDINETVLHDPKYIEITGRPSTIIKLYRECLSRHILPCGSICNGVIDATYKEIMNELGFEYLVTGGDTPKKGSDGQYSLFWKKPSGITILRGGFAFGLSKEKNIRYISDNDIPWVNPGCGGYDTDCLIPGVFFAQELNQIPNHDLETVVKNYPIILEYLSERVRFGIINRKDAIGKLGVVDIASNECYQELLQIFESSVERES